MQRAIELGDGDFFSGMHFSIEDARDCQASQIVAVVEIRDENLEWSRRIAFGRRNCFYDRIEQWPQIFAPAFDVGGSGAGFGVGVEHREIDLFLFRVEVDKEIVNLV